MDKQFVSYDISLQLQEKGFDEVCFGFYWKDTHGLVYDNAIGKHNGMHIQAPIYQQVVDWFREKHQIQIRILPYYHLDDYFLGWCYEVDHYKSDDWFKFNQGFYEEYYVCFNVAINEALKLI